MPRKTLAQLQAEHAGKTEKEKRLPTRSYTAYLDLEGLAQIQALEEEKADLELEEARKRASDEDDDERPRRPRKMGEGVNPRIAEINDEIAAHWATVRESRIDLLLRAIDGGEWIRWKDAHPPREDNKADDTIAWGYCNALDLIDDLGRFVVEVNDEPLTDGAWDEWLGDALAPADLKALVVQVLSMHEVQVTVPKESSDSSATPTNEPASNSPEASASPRNDSSAGNPPAPTSTTASTNTATPT